MEIKKVFCEKCNRVIDVDDLLLTEGDIMFGRPIYYNDECPHCGGHDFTELLECKSCGEYVPEELYYDGYCENCVEKAATPENLIEWCDIEDEKKFLEVNSAVASMCRELKINIEDLLKEVINESVYKDRIEKACKESVKHEFDTEYFMKWWKNRG